MGAPIVTAPPVYSLETVETALCLWEAALEARDTPLGRALFEREGTCAARSAVIGWAEQCDSDYAACYGAGQALEPFDWEHCPAWLAMRLAIEFPETWAAMARGDV
jgi:hypothetical protein